MPSKRNLSQASDAVENQVHAGKFQGSNTVNASPNVIAAPLRLGNYVLCALLAH